ncbi:X antigen family member 3-like, partial [Suricata suricatta]|uniref:X antigen family member 3-like n=1 Tax=Suricata suricatta TaxID=37032 RepID=UPI001155B7B7
MIWPKRSTFRPTPRRNDPNPFQLVGPVAPSAQQPSVGQPQREEPPTELQDRAPDQEKKGKGAPVVQGKGKGKTKPS